MFLVLAHTNEHIAARMRGAATDSVPEYRCDRIFGSEQEADAYCNEIDPRVGVLTNPAAWREVAFLFVCREATEGQFAVCMGDNGMDFASSSPLIAVGLFETREEACAFADNNGAIAEDVFELDVAHAEQVAA